MKIGSFIFGFLLLTFSNTYGQFKFKDDKDFKYQSDSLLQTVSINHPDFIKVDFELRYWVRDLSRTYAHELFILDHYHNKQWHLRHYQICLIQDRYSIISFNDSNLIGFDDQWTKLVSNKILSLPTELIAAKKWKTKNGLLTIIVDGDVYVVELVTEKAKRKYSYSSPKENLKIYDQNNEGLPDFIIIMDLLNHLFEYNESGRYKCPQ